MSVGECVVNTQTTASEEGQQEPEEHTCHVYLIEWRGTITRRFLFCFVFKEKEWRTEQDEIWRITSSSTLMSISFQDLCRYFTGMALNIYAIKKPEQLLK